MKRYLMLPLLCFFLVNSAHATPDASDWYKVDLIGSNGTNFYYYLTHEELPGSYYYSFTKYYLVSRNIKTGEIVEKIHLKTTKNISEETIEDGEIIFTHEYEHPFMSDVNPMEILRDNDVEALFPDFDAEGRYEFDEKGMYFVKKGKRIDVVLKEYLDRFIPGYAEWLDDGKRGVSIIQVYSSRDYYYYLLQYGVGGDIDFFQAILPISRP